MKLRNNPVLEKIWTVLGVMLLLTGLVVVLAKAAGASVLPRATVLAGNDSACSLTNPEFMLNAGNATIHIHQGSNKFRANHTPDSGWNDPYITAGYNKSINSGLCNHRALAGGGHGRSFPIPARLSHAGRYTGSVHNWTSTSFGGDTGYDIWLSGSPANNTLVKMERSGANTTEVMIWLNHPGLYTYHSRGSVVISGRHWNVIRSTASQGIASNSWQRIFFISPDNGTGTVKVNNLYLNPFLSYAMRVGSLDRHDWLMSINEGGEFTRGSMSAEGYSLIRQ